MPRGLAAARPGCQANLLLKFPSVGCPVQTGIIHEESATVRDAGSLQVGKRLSSAQIRAREAVVPGKLVFVPHRPKEAEEKGSCGKHVSHAAEEHLPGRRGLPGETSYLQVSQHHARGCTTENCEESEVLQIDDGECRCVDNRSQLAQRELAPEGAEEHQEAAVGKQQATKI